MSRVLGSFGSLRCSAVEIAFNTSPREGRKTGSEAAPSGRLGSLRGPGSGLRALTQWVATSVAREASVRADASGASQKLPAGAGRVVTRLYLLPTSCRIGV